MTSSTSVRLVSEATKSVGRVTTRRSNIRSGKLEKKGNRNRKNGRKTLEGIKRVINDKEVHGIKNQWNNKSSKNIFIIGYY